MVPSQEANGDNLGIFFFDFLHNNCMLCVLIRIASIFFSNFYTIIVCCVYSLESPHRRF